jgi:hypothetical protein
LDLKITYDTVDGNLVGLNICFRNENLTMELGCAKISLFETSLKVTKDILAQLSDTSNPLYSIEATEEMINKIKNLSATNMDDEIYIEAKENAAYLKGNSFEYKIADNISVNNSYGFMRQNIKNVDIDSYNLSVLEDKTVFKSMTNNTIVIMAKLIG